MPKVQDGIGGTTTKVIKMLHQDMETRKYNIVYDRSAKTYMVVDHDGVLVQAFPAKQKGDAVRFAINLLEPAIAAAADSMSAEYPTLERVAWAGAELVIDGAVHPRRVQGDLCVAMVDSSDGMGRYALVLAKSDDGYNLTCNCDAYTLGSAATYTVDGRERRLCKHMAAYTLIRRATKSSNN